VAAYPQTINCYYSNVQKFFSQPIAMKFGTLIDLSNVIDYASLVSIGHMIGVW